MSQHLAACVMCDIGQSLPRRNSLAVFNCNKLCLSQVQQVATLSQQDLHWSEIFCPCSRLGTLAMLLYTSSYEQARQDGSPRQTQDHKWCDMRMAHPVGRGGETLHQMSGVETFDLYTMSAVADLPEGVHHRRMALSHYIPATKECMLGNV
jgi:hypothetical protein